MLLLSQDLTSLSGVLSNSNSNLRKHLLMHHLETITIREDKIINLKFCAITFIFSRLLNNNLYNLIDFTSLKVFILIKNYIELVIIQLKLISFNSLISCSFLSSIDVTIINKDTQRTFCSNSTIDNFTENRKHMQS